MLFVLPNSVFTYFFYFSDHFASHCCDFRPTINLYNDLFFHSTCKHPPKPSPRNAWKLNRPGGHYKKGFDGQLWSIWGALSIQRCYPAELRFVCRGASWRLFVTRCQHLRNLHTLSGLDLNPKVQILHLHYIFYRICIRAIWSMAPCTVLVSCYLMFGIYMEISVASISIYGVVFLLKQMSPF